MKHFLLVLAVFSILDALTAISQPEELWASDKLHYRPVSNPHLGAVSGNVIYQRDVNRPWKFGRYYLKNRVDGALSGAVVCLAGRNIKKWKSQKPEKPTLWKMDQMDFEFKPELLAIRAGDKIQFLNSDNANHNVNIQGKYDSSNITTTIGQTALHQFKKGGNEKSVVEITCNFHSQMRAWIYVFNHPFYQITLKEGAFHLQGIPPGKYKIHTLHSPGKLHHEQEIRIIAGKELQMDIKISPADLTSEDKK